MKKFAVSKIGGKGLMLLFQELFDLINYILSHKDSETQIIIVVSAFENITRRLQDIFEYKISGQIDMAMGIFESIKNIHLERSTQLFIENPSIINDYFCKIESFILKNTINEKNPSISKAQLLKFGELMSSEIFYQFLCNMGLNVNFWDAREFIICNSEDYCNAKVSQPETNEALSMKIEKLNNNDIILTQGYIGRNKKHEDKLLGLDGSDLTAELIATGIKFMKPHYRVYPTTFWKDKDGVLDRNNNVYQKLTHDEYASLPSGPVRTDTIELAKKHQMVNIVRSFINLNNPGTIIQG